MAICLADHIAFPSDLNLGHLVLGSRRSTSSYAANHPACLATMTPTIENASRCLNNGRATIGKAHRLPVPWSADHLEGSRAARPMVRFMAQ
jgi:hypothetical protein